MTPLLLSSSAVPPPAPAKSAIVRSALWAAWADALGFQTELAEDEHQVQRRLGTGLVETTVPWTRRVGGRFGVSVELPAGTYSDDTQLRLAVSRCIRASGRFDAEAFSKIELSVFLSYELGAGIGTKAAAHALSKRNVRWYSNFFDTKRSRYIDGGGNGAAMRIQPHVWAAPGGASPEHYLPAVVQNAVVTHGHPRGILGAAMHGLALGSTLREGEIPEPDRWPAMLNYLRRLPEQMSDDPALAERWIPLWERASEEPWASAVQRTLDELSDQVTLARGAAAADGPISNRYAALSERLGGLDRKTRGSGAVAAVLSLWLAWVARDRPAEGLLAAANLIGSDTDTVATMAGALLGVVAATAPPGPVLDEQLLTADAARLQQLGRGERVDDFPHPDPMNWRSPPTLVDSLGRIGDQPVVSGLGPVSPLAEPVPGSDDAAWQWNRTDFGQSLLIKRRTALAPIADFALPRPRDTAPRPVPATAQIDLESARPKAARSAAATGGQSRRTRREDGLPIEVEDALALVKNRKFDQILVARLLFHFARQPYGSSKAAIFGGEVARLLREREGLMDPSIGQSGEQRDRG
jgi:ADP-ribosylglycohydrolase